MSSTAEESKRPQAGRAARPQALGGSPAAFTARAATRATTLTPFLAMEVMERGFALEAAGRRILHLEVGEPQFDPPAAALAACAEALAAGETNYTDSRGTPELRRAIAVDVGARAGVSVDPERVIVTSGTSPAMLMVFSLLLEAGDEVIVPAPAYPCIPNFVRFCGGEPVIVPTRAEDGYRVDPRAVAERVTPRTKAIALASPCNPTGAVESEATVRELAALGPALLFDQIYDGLVYEGARSWSPLAIANPEVDERSFVFDGFSKRYAMTGFRLGYVVAPGWAMRPLQVMQQNFFISPNPFVQRAGLAALHDGDASVAAARRVCEARRDRLVEGLRALGFHVPVLPQGAFYVLADASGLGCGALGRDSRALANALLEEAGVGATPGIDFGEAGEGRLRFCYAVSDAVIDEALAAIAEALPRLRERGAELGASA